MKYLFTKVHISWLIAVGCLFFVVGVWLALYIHTTNWWLIALGIVAIGGVLYVRRLFTIPFLATGCLMVGIFYGSTTLGDLDIYSPFIDTQITLSGKVKEDPVIGKSRALTMQLSEIEVAGHAMPGSLWVSVVGKPDILRGDVITIAGKLEQGFGTFSGVIYKADVISISRPMPGDVGRVVRDWFADAIRKAIPEPQASLGIGYLTGQKSALPEDLSEALQIAGLSHIVVASGYNLTILVRLSRRIFMKVSKFVSATTSAVLVMCFIAVTGMSPSMTRAGLVSGLSLLTWYYGRRFHPFVLLPFAAAITVAFQPSYIWGDLGWQLSFAAFAGVMVVAPLLQRFFFGETKPGTIRQIVGETVAAHVITVPIVVIAFGVLSNVAIPANIFIVPLVPLAMLLTFISGLVALIVPAIAVVVALPATWLLTYMTETATYLAGLPWAQIEITMPWWGGVIYYVMLIGICVCMWRMAKLDLREANLVV